MIRDEHKLPNRVDIGSFLMLYAIKLNDLETSQNEGFKIKPEWLFLDIDYVHLYFFRNRQFVAAINLCPSRQTRQNFMYAYFRT